MKTNKIFKVLSLILALAMILTVAGCAGAPAEESKPAKDETSTAAPAESTATEDAGEEEATEEETTKEWPSAGPDDTTEHYSFEIYANYDWWTVQPWGEDAATAYWNELFNIDVTWTKPDADQLQS
jgi:hypothetical protein